MSASVSAFPLPPEADEKDPNRRVLSGNFEVTLNSADKRTDSMKSLRFTGPIYADDSPEEVNARVDLYQTVVDRQVTLSDIKKMEDYIAGETVNLDLMAKQKEGLDRKVDAGAKPSSTEKEKLRQYGAARDAALDRIAKLQADIATAKKKIGIET